MRGICWVAEKLLASQEGLSSMELVSVRLIGAPRIFLLGGRADPEAIYELRLILSYKNQVKISEATTS
jgi:hypothetical protein